MINTTHLVLQNGHFLMHIVSRLLVNYKKGACDARIITYGKLRMQDAFYTERKVLFIV